MAKNKPYIATADLEVLRNAEAALNRCETAADVIQACKDWGSKCGYKAWCKLLKGELTPEQMKGLDAQDGEGGNNVVEQQSKADPQKGEFDWLFE